MERHRAVKRRATPPAREEGRRGRPRSEESHEAILSSAISLIRRVGYDAVSIDGIAAHAGVGKATVYRRWPSKELLVAEALEQLVRTVPIPDTGALRSDLLSVLRSSIAMYADAATFELLSGLVAAMARSKPIGDAVRGGFHAARRDAVRAVLERGVRRGELSPEVDVELFLDVLHGTPFYRHLVTRGPVDPALGERLVELLLRANPPANPKSGARAR